MNYLILLLLINLWSQDFLPESYESYLSGNLEDVVTEPKGGICLMGGSREVDHAMARFLLNANGGDVLVLRASGSDGYNEYLLEELGVRINSVETIIFKNKSASKEKYIHQKIKQAEAIWLAGGNQWNYVNYWRNTAIDSLINEGIRERNIVIGGTSAGMAVLGGAYFSAKNGGIRSEVALADPFDPKMSVDLAPFFDLPILKDVITDTHYSERDRQGRHLAFMARAYAEKKSSIKGIALDERTAIFIDAKGKAYVHGSEPDVNGHAFFIQTNCMLPDQQPESCSPGKPLNWNAEGRAIWVYKVKGKRNSHSYFDLNDWKSGSGGNWEYWAAKNGQLHRNLAGPISCQ